jgi:hypothetical protein
MSVPSLGFFLFSFRVILIKVRAVEARIGLEDLPPDRYSLPPTHQIQVNLLRASILAPLFNGPHPKTISITHCSYLISDCVMFSITGILQAVFFAWLSWEN